MISVKPLWKWLNIQILIFIVWLGTNKQKNLSTPVIPEISKKNWSLKIQ